MQEKMFLAMEDQSRAMQETMEALLSEVIWWLYIDPIEENELKFKTQIKYSLINILIILFMLRLARPVKMQQGIEVVELQQL